MPAVTPTPARLGSGVGNAPTVDASTLPPVADVAPSKRGAGLWIAVVLGALVVGGGVFFVVRGQKKVAWVLGFFQALIFVLAISSVLKNLDNPLNILGYAAGFATGNVVGMWIEERLAIGHMQLSIVSSRLGTAIAERMRTEGYAITEIPARGKDGMVSLLSCSVLRRQVDKVHAIVHEQAPGITQ